MSRYFPTVDLDPESGQLVFSKIRETINGQAFQDLLDVWLFDYQGQPHLNQASCQESQACRWMTVDQIQELYDAGKFAKNLDYFFMMDLKNFEAWKANLIKQDQAILQTIVHGKIDRPLGSVHPKYPDLVYPINYGYVPEVIGGDGEEQDVYFLGSDQAQTDFSGEVIGVWHRLNDVETKWIVAAPGQQFSAAQILAQIAFQEQYFYGLLILADRKEEKK